MKGIKTLRKVIWIDEDGWRHCSQIRDSDPDTFAERGVPCLPPDVNEIDWQAVKRDIHNLLVERELFTLADVRFKGEQIRNIPQAVLYQRLLELYTKTP